MHGKGFLGIWSDAGDSKATDYLHWLTREHTTERLTTDGFIAVRVFRAAGIDVARFFILYDLDGPEVLSSSPYMHRLATPTPWTQRVMPTLANFIRGGGRRVASAGIGQGGVIAVLALEEVPAPGAKLIADLAGIDRIAEAHLLATDHTASAIQTPERAMRTNDRSFAGLLVIGGLDEDATRSALAHLPTLAPDLKIDRSVPELVYTQIFALDRTSLS